MDDLQDALAELEDDAFTWKGVEFPCTAGDYKRSSNLEEGGYAIEADLTIVCRAGLFGSSPPSRNQVVTHKAIQYRIDNVATAPGGFLVLSCQHDSKGA